MGNVVPDRFFWALPPPEEGEEGPPEGEPPEGESPAASRRIH
jgi:hydroxymethylpyrimidine/phosphomethylpyrimidine kinase